MNTIRPSSARTVALPRFLTGLLAWFALTAGLTAQSAAPGLVNGRVTEAANRTVLAGAEVTVVGSDARTATTRDGEFSLSLPTGNYTVSVNYLGLPTKTLPVTVVAGQTVALPVVLGSDTIQLEAFKITATREGQARAINQQRTSQNLTNIISSDLNGQFPDKTIADAVKRLPGVTVETDTDTGGSEGRYVTIRGMNADFNAVSINGMRVAVSDFGGLSRRVPLDVVSAKSADQIEVTKALRPDQDGDGIGGAVNIVTRSPFDRSGLYAFAEAAIGTSRLLDRYTGDYPYENPSTEAAAGFSQTFGADRTIGLALSANYRDRAFVKQRIGTGGWAADRGPGGPYYPIALNLQDFFDDLTSTGLNSTFEWRPSAAHKLRFDLGYSERETERGRQRLQNGFINLGTGATANGNYTDYTSTGRMTRNIRQFFEDQTILNLIARGESQLGDWKVDYFAGLNRGNFDGDADRDISASFRTASTAKTISLGSYFPTLSGATYLGRVNTPSAYFFNALDRGTSFVSDEEIAAGLDLKRALNLGGATGTVQAGWKTRAFSRDYDSVSRRFRVIPGVINDWALDGFFGYAPVGSSLASYRSNNSVEGRYDFGFFLDPNTVRRYADTLATTGPGGRAVLEATPDNALRSQARSYQSEEDIHAVYLQTQQTWGKLTALIGARAEMTRVNFKGSNARTSASTGFVTSVTPYDQSNDYLDVLPGLHLRYAQSDKLLYRFAVTRSLARPRLSDLNPSIFEDPFGEDAFSRPGSFLATLDRGNIKLDPTRSTNVDISAEYYFGSASTLSVGLFLKDMQDNVYRAYVFNDPAFPNTLVRTSRNAKSAQVRGIELSYDQVFTFLPAPLDGFGFTANYTFADSEVDTGLAQFARADLPLFNQVRDTVNAGFFFDKYGFRARASLLYRSASLLGLSIDEDFRDYDLNLSRFQAASTSLDVTASYRFRKNWTIFGEVQNVLNTPGRAYNGNKTRFDYNEYTDWNAQIGLRWSL
jgi:TonB-dependent receptor